MKHLYLRTHSPKEWVVTQSYEWRDVRVGAGFITDLASIPWIVAFLFVTDDTRKAATIHDWLYCSNNLSRYECDNLFKEALIESGVSKLHAQLLYLGVRIGGWVYYNKCEGGLTLEDMASVGDDWRDV